MTIVTIIDADIGNLRSVQKAFERAGATTVISGRAEDVAAAEALVLPGVGAFGDAMRKLNELGLTEALRQEVGKRGKPLLGICLGMQLLARSSTEGGLFEGLRLIDAAVERMDVRERKDWARKKLTLPHIGWNTAKARSDSQLFAGIAPKSDFYFVHSYAVKADREADVAATCEYGDEFAAAIESGNILATQFHPEKSHRDGYRLIENYLRICSGARAAA